MSVAGNAIYAPEACTSFWTPLDCSFNVMFQCYVKKIMCCRDVVCSALFIAVARRHVVVRQVAPKNTLFTTSMNFDRVVLSVQGYQLRVGSHGDETFNILEIVKSGFKKIGPEALRYIFQLVAFKQKLNRKVLKIFYGGGFLF